MSGKFITIEGTDGAGKTTQIKLLVEYLEKKGLDVIVTREPGGTKIGEIIREIILDVNNSEMHHITEVLLYAASRAQHVNEKIIPAVKAGKIVICDRFTDSSFVYQGYARGLSLKMIGDINKYAENGLSADLTLFFDMPPAVGISRKKNMQTLDRIESENLEFHDRVYNGYLELSNKYPERIKRINAEKTIEEVHKAVINEVEKLF